MDVDDHWTLFPLLGFFFRQGFKKSICHLAFGGERHIPAPAHNAHRELLPVFYPAAAAKMGCGPYRFRPAEEVK
jgi:hypothetical protein